MKFEINKQKYIDSGLITEKKHPKFPLLIYNYTPQCQYLRSWDYVTMMCRGLIVHEETREIIARPFPKFFNYEEHVENGDTIPNETPVVYPKMDGSLGILYWWEDEPYIATRGSFVSDQALWANDFLEKVQNWTEKLDKSKTYLFEIIYPENRIVLDYGNQENLVLLAVIDTETGISEDIHDTDFPFVSEVPFTSFEELKALDLDNEEGFVLFYPKSQKRIKIKFETYVKLHKVITGLSEKGVWEMLKDGEDPFKQDIPDEMHKWLNSVVNELQVQYHMIHSDALKVYEAVKDMEIRKLQAEYITKMRNPGLVFSLIDGKDIDQAIWRLIKPKGMSTFRIDIDK